MTRRMLWSLAVVTLMTAPILANPQDPNPCAAITAGLRCSTGISGPWANVKLGKPVVEPKPGESPWGWAAPAPSSQSKWTLAGHSVLRHSALGDVTIHEIAPGAVDCAMAKPANPATDTRMVHSPRGGVTFSSVVVPVPPCKAK